MKAQEGFKIICIQVPKCFDREAAQFLLSRRSWFLYKPEIEKADVCYNAKSKQCKLCQEPECELCGMDFSVEAKQVGGKEMIKITPRGYDTKTTMEIFDITAEGFEHAVGWVEQKEDYIPTVHITHPKYKLDKVALGKVLKKKWGMNGDYFLVTETVFLRDEIAKARCLADKISEEKQE